MAGGSEANPVPGLTRDLPDTSHHLADCEAPEQVRGGDPAEKGQSA